MNRQSCRPERLSGVLTATTVYLGLLSALGPLGPGDQSKTGQRASAPSALAARSISLNESGNLHLTSRHGFTLNERGPASGTIAGTIYVHLKIVSSKRVAAEVNIYPSGGSISGYGSASYRREGATGSFSGSISINRGTGSYNHARGSGLSFSGTIRRSDYAITVHVRGNVTD
jgi:hypothetical protein